jgi:hypothetical protein
MLVAALMGWLISRDAEVPWTYRYGGMLAIGLGVALPSDVVRSLARVVTDRFTRDRGGSDRQSDRGGS